jgi:MerR family mercuric resistance operon transcriptional regulator
MAVLSISRLAEAGEVGVETIRFYQRKGLLPVPEKSGGNGLSGGFRRYGDEDVRRLRFIRAAQRAGFTLEEIRTLLSLDAGEDRAQARSLARERLAILDAQIEELERARASLRQLAQACAHSDEGPCPILKSFGV